MNNNELIQQARELCEKATQGPWEAGLYQSVSAAYCKICNAATDGDAAFIAASRTIVPRLCDALEVATARAEKAEAEIKSVHEALNFADKSRAKCTNYAELAVSNGLALGKIAVAIRHDYNSKSPKGE